MAFVPATRVEATGDGITSLFGFGFPYESQADVYVTVDGVATSFTFSAPNIVSILPAPVNLSTVVVYRETPALNMHYIFTSGVPFLTKFADTNWRQLLYVFQEFVNDNLLNRVNLTKTLRTLDVLNLLPDAGTRANKIVGFDAVGQPVVLSYSSSSVPGLDVRLTLVENSVNILNAGRLATVPTFNALSLVPAVVGQKINTYCHTSGVLGGGSWLAVAGVVTSNGGTKIPSATVGVYWQRVDYISETPEMFGCLRDGVTSDTDNFKKCIAASLDIQLTAGTYLLTKTGTSGDYLLYLGTQGAGGNPTSRNGIRIRGMGDKSIIKLGNAIGVLPLVFGGATGDVFADMIFEDFVIDLNGSNNLQTSYGGAYRYNNAFYFYCVCNNILFDNIRIKNLAGSQGIRIGNDSSAGFGSNIRVLRSNFENFGIGLPGNLQQDCSMLFIQANDVLVDDCEFKNNDFTFDLARGHTACELHGDSSTVTANNRFRYVQLPINVASDQKDTNNFIIEGNTMEQCNYMFSCDPGAFSQKRVNVTGNIFQSQKSQSIICPLGLGGTDAAKTRESILFEGNIVDCTGNTNQGTHLFAPTNAYLKSLQIIDNDLKGLNGSSVYVAGQVKDTGVLDIVVKNNRMDSLGATGGSYPNSPAFAHVEHSSGTINNFTFSNNTLSNTLGKNYSTFGCVKLVGAINYIGIKGNDGSVTKSYPMVTDASTSVVYKDIESSYERPIDYRTTVVAVPATSSVNIFDFSSFTLNEHAMFDIKLWIGVGGTSNNSVFHYTVAANSAAKTATLVLSNGTYSANITINFSGNTLRVTSTSGSALSMYMSVKGYTTLPIAWLV